jgi:hypothetical protein
MMTSRAEVEANRIPSLKRFHCSSNRVRSFSKVRGFCCVKFLELSSSRCVSNVKNYLKSKRDVQNLYFHLVVVMSMGSYYVSELRPPAGLSFVPQTIHDYGDPRWNDIDRGKPKNSERTCSSATSPTTKPHMDWPGREFLPQRWEAGD